MQKEGKRLPVLRDMKGSSYIRQERGGLLIGPYEEETRVRDDWRMGPPKEWAGFELFEENLERIESNLMAAAELVPVLAETGIATTVNGPTIWCGDGNPRVGRTNLPGWYDMNSLTYGIAHSPSLAEYLAGIMLDGEQPFDILDAVDPLRYGKWATDQYTADKVRDTYARNNHVAFGAYENRAAGRAVVAQAPIVAELVARGAVLGGFGGGGVESPIAFLPAGAATGGINHARFAAHQWASHAEEEAAAVLQGVGIGYSAYSKLRVRGPAAERVVDAVTTNGLPKLQRCKLTYATLPSGLIHAEFTVCRRGDGDLYLVGSRDHAAQDAMYLRTRRADLGVAAEDAAVHDASDEIDIIHIAGPRSRELIDDVCPDAAMLPFMAMAELGVGGARCEVFRISFSGCPGYELHCPRADAAAVLAAVCDGAAARRVGLRPFGGYALNALRVEKGYKLRADLDSAHYSEAGIEPFIAAGKQFVGRDDARAPVRRAAMFAIDTDAGWEWSVPGDCPVVRRRDGAVVGFTTSGARGASTAQPLALGYIHTVPDPDGRWEVAAEGDELAVQAYRDDWRARLLSAPPLPTDRGLPARKKAVGGAARGA